MSSMPCSRAPGPSALDSNVTGESILRRFGFREQPFGVTSDPSYLFFSEMHRAALQSLVHSIECNLGFAALLGDPGTGKTSLLLKLLTQYRSSARTAFVFQTQCTSHDLLRFLASEFELPPTDDEVLWHQQFKDMLVGEASAGRKVLVMIDEAQNLQDSSLEAIRLLSDFETRRSKLLHIILAGSAGLHETLLTPELSPLAQRISTVCRLERLRPDEVKAYVDFRLARAGYSGEDLFSSDSITEIAAQSWGIPRVINSLCYAALSLAYELGEQCVNSYQVKQAAHNLDLSRPRQHGAKQRDSRLRSKLSVLETRNPDLDRNPGLSWFPEAAPSVATQTTTPVPTPVAIPEAGENEGRSSPPQSEITQVVQHDQSRSTGDISVGGGRAQHVRVRGSYSLKSDPFALAIIALILTTVVIWVGWFESRGRSNALGHETGVLTPIVSPLKDKMQSATTNSATAPSDAQTITPAELTTAPAELKTAPAGTKTGDITKTQAGNSFESLPQLSLPSRLNQRTVTTTDVPDSAVPLVAPKSLSLPASSSWPVAVPRLRIEKVKEETVDLEQSPLGPPIKVVKPTYPKLAMLRRVEGEVVVELQVNPQGQVQSVRAITGPQDLRTAAEDAARQWEYPPSPHNQVSVPAVTRVRFNFKLQAEKP
jgi:TonB family protein